MSEQPAATYQPDLQRPLDRLRFQVGDTNADKPLLPDATYNAVLLAQANDERKATLALADALIVRFASMPSRTTSDGGRTSVEWRDRLAGWQTLATRLRIELAASTAATDSAFSTLRPQRPGREDRAEYRRECGDVEW